MGRFGAIWGVLGTALLLLEPIVRLSLHAREALASPLEPHHVVFGVLWTAALFFAEGYRGFQKGFSPRVVARAGWLLQSRSWRLAVFAPLVCMGLLHATKKRLFWSWVLVAIIIGFVFAVRLFDQPWRGLIDLGVAVSLAWGLGVMLVHAVRLAFTGRLPAIDADVPTATPGLSAAGAAALPARA